MNRRAFLGGMVATAAGVLIPDKRVWALDKTMVVPNRRVTLIEQPYDEYVWTPGWSGAFDKIPISAGFVDRETGQEWIEQFHKQPDGSYACAMGRGWEPFRANILVIPTSPSDFTMSLSYD